MPPDRRIDLLLIFGVSRHNNAVQQSNAPLNRVLTGGRRLPPAA